MGCIDKIRPRHLFGNVLERLHEVDYLECKAIESRILGEYMALKQRYHDNECDKEKFLACRGSMTEQLVSELSGCLAAAEFKSHAYCYNCKGLCPITPRSDETLRQKFWFEAAGSSCRSFSHANVDGAGWLDESTLVALT